jgi:hypothetical protein
MSERHPRRPARPFSRACTAAAIPCVAIALLFAAALGADAKPELKTETFDRDPNWDHANNRPADRRDEPVQVRQDFGYRLTAHAGGKAGEIGGFIQAAAEPAYYGKDIGRSTLDQPLSASGTLSVADGGTHLLLGFFNAGTVNEWRTPNTIALRINGRGDHFLAYLEYCTSKWRAGGDEPQSFPTREDPKTGRKSLVGFPSGGRVHHWSLTYDPKGSRGAGVIRATIDDASAVCNLDPALRADGAGFNRFGLLNVMKSADGGTEVYLDDVTVNGQTNPFDADPNWDARDNRKTYRTNNVRPRFDFGFSPTAFAGGKPAGEIGGLIFRGDCRYPQRMAYYADRVGPLTLDQPIHAAGTLVMLRGVTDSTVTFGFFNRDSAMHVNPAQSDAIPEGIIGFNIEGPSREGFCFYPIARPQHRGGAAARLDADSPHVYPDAKPRKWIFDYDPEGPVGRGRITVTLDGRAAHLDLKEGDKAAGTTFDRFGLITPWIDGNAQTVYFDDLTYTATQ